MSAKRRQLVAAIAVSLVLHGALLYLAPRVTLLAASSDLPRSLNSMDLEITAAFTPVQSQPSTISALPEDLSEHVALETLAAEIDPMEMEIPADTIPLPGPTPERTNSPLAATDDAILAIAEDALRESLNVERWQVATTQARAIAIDDTPAIRGIMEPGLTTPANVPNAPADTEAMVEAYGEPSPIEMLEEPVGLPQLPEEEVVARAPVIRRMAEESNTEALESFLHFELDTFVPKDQERGYFRLRIVPKPDANLEPLPKDITFVIDASRSIQQRKLDLTARGITSALEQLGPEDRFNIVAFRDSGLQFRGEPVVATPENKKAAREFAETLKSRGETDVFSALLPVVEGNVRRGIPGIVMVISDGRPTTGVQDGRAIINAVSAQNDANHSIFAFGAGRTVNQYLLDLLAYRNRGESSVGPNIEDIDDRLPAFTADLRNPILVDVDADFRADGVDEIYPRSLPDFYESRAIVVYGQYDPEKDDTLALRITGKARETDKEIVFRAPLREAPKGKEDIARGWAFRKVYALIDEICLYGETPERLAELRTLSRAHQIRTIYD